MVGRGPAETLARSLLRCHISFGDLGASASGRQIVVNEKIPGSNNGRMAPSLFDFGSIDASFDGLLFCHGRGVDGALAAFFKARPALSGLGITSAHFTARVALSSN